MIISAPTDYREAAERRLPRFLFDCIDGGAVTERLDLSPIEPSGRPTLYARAVRLVLRQRRRQTNRDVLEVGETTTDQQ
jgi:hypothetical protein